MKTLYCYCDLLRSSKVKGHGAKWKNIYMFLSMNNSNNVFLPMNVSALKYNVFPNLRFQSVKIGFSTDTTRGISRYFFATFY